MSVMFITNRHLNRRTFLRGIGATVALPLLDAMIPARALFAFGATAAPRLAFVYFPHGAVMPEWDGRILQPLAPFRNRLTIVDGIENRHAYGPVHAITPGTWLSANSPREGGMTADQIAAEAFGQHTPIRSIAVTTEAPAKICCGAWEGQYDESYGRTISFRGPNTPVPMEFRPRAVFDTLFNRAPGSSSVLDVVADEAARLRKQLGAADRSLLNDYFDTVRDVERRLDEDAAYADRITLMFDLIALAFRADITRVATMMMAAETSAMIYDRLGISESFHDLSHHQNDPDKIEKLVRIQACNTSLFASFIRTLASQRDGDGTLLDRSLILFGSNMSDSYAHDHFPLPLAVVGGGCGWRHQDHLRYPDRTPIATLQRAILHSGGV